MGSTKFLVSNLLGGSIVGSCCGSRLGLAKDQCTYFKRLAEVYEYICFKFLL